jgi:FeS assembly SUF system protein
MSEKIKDAVIAALRTVYDPEIPVNIYDLGLVYKVDVSEGGEVAITMTLTAPNCPVAGSLPAQVEAVARNVPGVTGVNVELTFDPPWDKERVSPDVLIQLGLM